MKIITHSKCYMVFSCVLLFSLISIQVGAQANFALGTSNATGTNAFAAGENSLAQGAASIAAGNAAQALADYSISLGDNTYADQRGAVAFGAFSYSQSEHALAFGLNNWIQPNAYYSVAIGAGNQVSAWGGLAVGRDNFSHGGSSVAIGTWNTARTYGEVVLGAYAEDYTPNAQNGYEWHPMDRAFVIGNGFGDGAGNGTRQNALVILKNGNTQLNGNLSLTKRLHVGDDDTATPEPGDIRYNFVNNDFEGFLNGLGWKSFTQGASANSRGIGTFSKGRIFSWDMEGSNPSIQGELDQGLIGISCIAISNSREVIIGGGIGIGNFAQSTMTITKPLDKSSTEILKALHNKTDIDEATFAVEIPAGSSPTGQAEVDYQYILRGIKVTSYSFSVDDGGQPVEDIVLSFECYELTDNHYNDSGQAGTTTTKWSYITRDAQCN